jgi:hypothetical protein
MWRTAQGYQLFGERGTGAVRRREEPDWFHIVLKLDGGGFGSDPAALAISTQWLLDLWAENIEPSSSQFYDYRINKNDIV